MIKRLLFTVVVVAIVALLSVSLASADGGPHGGFTATTDACAGCHRTHTALGPGLRVDTTNTYNLCITCHGTTGTGANANVLDGVWVSPLRKVGDTTGITNTVPGGPLLGGGFLNYKGAPVTSSHSPTGTLTAAWGNGVNRGATAALSRALDCASCHDPHGSPNYRIIRASVNGTAVTVGRIDEGVAKDYDTEQWGTGQSNVCAACHGAYHRINSGQGSTSDAGTYTHRVDMAWNASPVYSNPSAVNPETTGVSGLTLPLAVTGAASATTNLVVCQTCHLPHGTSATMTGNAAGDYDPGGVSVAPGPIPSGDSALLRLNNRAVCQVCHQK